MTIQKPVIAEINLDNLAANTTAMRELIGSTRRMYGVVKGDAYGMGLLRAAPVVLEAGCDAIATANPEDVVQLRRIGVQVPILLYPATPITMAGAVAELDAIITLHDLPGIAAYATQPARLEAHLKIDCGFGRLGLQEVNWASAFEALQRASNIRLSGVYTHLGQTEDAGAVDRQMTIFQRAITMAESYGFRDLEKMVASTRVAIGYRRYHLDAVNPGIGLYGLLEGEWLNRFQCRQVLQRLWTSVLQVKTLPAGSTPGVLGNQALQRDMTIAVIAAGFANGLPRIANNMPVLIHGRRAPTLGLRSTEHTIVDVTEISNVVSGDEVVIVGRQDEQEITALEFVETSQLPLLEAVGRLCAGAEKNYTQSSSEA